MRKQEGNRRETGGDVQIKMSKRHRGKDHHVNIKKKKERKRRKEKEK